MTATEQATFWVFVGLILFFGVLVYFKVPKMVAKGLDGRAERIRNELDEARELREEAQQVLAELQRKRREAEEDAAKIVASAKREAEMIRKEAKENTEDYVRRRTASAEEKIARAESDAVAAVRSRAIDLATIAAHSVIAERVDAAKQNELVSKSLTQMKSAMN